MSESARTFNDFEFHDNVYELSGGLIPEIAERLDVHIADTPNTDDLQLIMDRVGKNKILRDNAEITALSREDMVGYVDRSGLQQAMNRSLVRPDLPVNSITTDAIVIVGGVANWQDRAANVVVQSNHRLPVYAIAGSRWMDTATEVTNPNVKQFFESREFGYYPSEAAYAAEVILPRLVRADITVEKLFTHNSQDGDVLFEKFFTAHPELLEQRLALVRTANAGVIMAIQMRNAARKLNPDFDTDPITPQTLIETDAFPIATTDEQDNDSAHFQKAATALRQVVLTAKKLFESQR